MKRIIITIALLAGINYAHAQAAADGDYYGEDVSKAKATIKAPTADNEYANTEMSYANGTITFSDVPKMPKPTWAIITTTTGESIKQMRITNGSSLDVHRFQKGMYFVTLVYRNKSKKGFTLSVE